ncbi:ImmA/IrrE family metallo-endopeptidase [Streptomyces sp. NPDC013978]|uniref:ImmA/IrrE family metallo-endopeptidase n=1 Tax=Streptomyces sp. NPDC013978 TaxID=3364869 RepID=UPI0036FD6529
MDTSDGSPRDRGRTAGRRRGGPHGRRRLFPVGASGAVLTPRHRFTAAHELGHLVLHGDATGDSRQEREPTHSPRNS